MLADIFHNSLPDKICYQFKKNDKSCPDRNRTYIRRTKICCVNLYTTGHPILTTTNTHHRKSIAACKQMRTTPGTPDNRSAAAYAILFVLVNDVVNVCRIKFQTFDTIEFYCRYVVFNNRICLLNTLFD